MKDYNSIIFTSEHNHCGGDTNDSVDEQKTYINRIKECGYKKFAVTGHGGFSCMQTMIDLAKKEDIQIIYGLEAYIEVPPYEMKEKAGHLILLAVDEAGKHIIDRLNSHAAGSRLGKPVISRKQLEDTKFDGHVIATSACVSGAPALVLQFNKMLEESIEKLEDDKINELEYNEYEEKIPKYLSPDNPDYLAAKEKLENLKKSLDAYIAERDDASIKEMNKADKAALRKATKAGEEEIISELEKKVLAYQIRQTELKNLISETRKEISPAKLKYDYLQRKVDGWNKIDEKIESLKTSKTSDDKIFDKCLEEIKYFNALFGQGNYFIEIQNHGMPLEAEIYPKLAKAAKQLGVPLVAANDAHMPDNSESSLMKRNVARYLRFQKIDEQEWDKELYVKTPNELAESLLKIFPEDVVDEAMLNLNVIGERCTYIPKKVNHYPVFDKDKDSNKLLWDEIQKGIKWRFPNPEDWTKERQDRIDYEYGVITSMGFADYHLIVKDFLEYGRIVGKVPEDKIQEVPLTIEGAKKYVEEHNYKLGAGIGLGRGSGAGSLVTYLLGITNIDPFKYGLIFERFLNPERISMPDIDSDLAVYVREKTIEYVKAKYGEEAVVGIITETREGVKGAIRDAARYLGGKEHGEDKFFLNLGNAIRKKVPDAPQLTFSSIIYDEVTVYDMLVEECQDNADALEILRIARDIEGMLCGYGQHAAGVVIYGAGKDETNDISNYIPIRNGENGKITEMDMIQVEANGLLKMDFLGLKTLNILTDTIREIEKNHGISFNVDDIPTEGVAVFDGKEFDTRKVYENIFEKGNTKDVFQFESAGMRSMLKQMAK